MLAICESGGGEAWGYVVPILVIAAWGGIVFAIFRRSAAEDLPWLTALLFGCMAIGVLLPLGTDGLHGDGDHVERFFISVGVSAALGLATGFVRKRATLRSVGAAIAGDIFLPGLLALALIWFFVGDGVCID